VIRGTAIFSFVNSGEARNLASDLLERRRDISLRLEGRIHFYVNFGNREFAAGLSGAGFSLRGFLMDISDFLRVGFFTSKAFYCWAGLKSAG
jgi:hypothetical protein